MKIELVGTEPTRKAGDACDFVTVRVDGQEEQWAEAGRLLGWWAEVRDEAQHLVRFRIVRSPLHQPVTTTKVLDMVTRQFHNITRPDPTIRRPRKAVA